LVDDWIVFSFFQKVKALEFRESGQHDDFVVGEAFKCEALVKVEIGKAHSHAAESTEHGRAIVSKSDTQRFAAGFQSSSAGQVDPAVVPALLQIANAVDDAVIGEFRE